jgi:hypothetical protein
MVSALGELSQCFQSLFQGITAWDRLRGPQLSLPRADAVTAFSGLAAKGVTSQSFDLLADGPAYCCRRGDAPMDFAPPVISQAGVGDVVS